MHTRKETLQNANFSSIYRDTRILQILLGLFKRRGFLVIIFFLAYLCSVIFYITQPLFYWEKIDETHKQTETFLSDETQLKIHTKTLSEINRSEINGLTQSSDYIQKTLQGFGIKESQIRVQKYTVNTNEYHNISVIFPYNIEQFKGPKTEIPKYIIGAHYDSAKGTPGADDNASGVAGLLEIARGLQNLQQIETSKVIELVFYSTEEPPFFGSENMGSFHHANSVKEEKIAGVFILEMIGYYSSEKNSQFFPVPLMKYLYPNEGNFIAIVSNFSNPLMTRKIKSHFTSHLESNGLISVESINGPSVIQGVDFSDHRNYWKFDIPAFMITDTSFFRNQNYHTPEDTFEKLDYKKMKEVVDATFKTVISF